MNDQKPVVPPINPVSPTPPVVPVVENKFQKFLNKKTLTIVGVVFGVFLLLIILVSLITKNVKKIITPKPSPTPISNDVINNLPVSSVSGELAPAQIQLSDLKKQIDDLDIKVARLQPPSVNFKINFGLNNY